MRTTSRHYTSVTQLSLSIEEDMSAQLLTISGLLQGKYSSTLCVSII